ncbi:MAG TPA: formyltetrahydrofolate deformylase [Alphaproteobacteria bacterium]|nr:formyltetrahydrofolate deformylase [Alphaproteobacteria bacterium]
MTTDSCAYILTISCPDRLGIVAAVASALADAGLFITDSHHFGDPDTGRFFMRTRFETNRAGVAGQNDFSRTAFNAAFSEIAARFAMQWQLHDAAARPAMLLLVSKFDHCLNDLLYRYRTGTLPVEIPAIISNHTALAPLAEWHDIPFFHIPVTAETKPAAEAQLRDIIASSNAEFVVLARYMQILSPELCTELAGRAVNIHHSFLPSFKGARPYQQAHRRGVKQIGATAHFVTPDLDEGPIIEQMVERVDHNHTAEEMAAIGRDVEAQVLARAVRWIAERRVFLNGDKTVIFRHG